MPETRTLSQDDARQWLRLFVQYLNQTGALSREDLAHLTRFHSAIDRRIGQLGVLKGYLTLKDVYTVLSEQNDENLPFGLAAIRAGFLSEAQVQELLQLQKNTFLLFLESLMLMGVLKAEALNETVKGFRESLVARKPSSPPTIERTAEPAPEASTAARLGRDDVRSRLKKVRGLVSMPAVIQRVLSMTQDADCDVARVAEVISSDPILSTQLLRMVNSAASGLPRRITRMTEAISRVGITAVRNLALATMVVSRFEGDDRANLSSIWMHSVTTSRWAQALARLKGGVGPEDAFIAGLIHDVGRPVLLNVFPAQFKAVQERVAGGASLSDAEREYFDQTHADVGAFLCETWTFPIPLVQAVGHHHASLHVLEDMGKPARLTRIVHASCRLAELPFSKDDPVANGKVLATLDETFREFHELDEALLTLVPEVCGKTDELAGWLE